MKGPREFPEILLVPSPTSEHGRATIGFKWAETNVGRRHKVGGSPDWLQAPDVPQCPACREAMTFYGQLDSVGDNMTIADAGMLYVFICFDCNECKSVLQSG